MEINKIAITVMEQMKARSTAQLFEQGVLLQSLEGEYLHTLTPEQELQVKQLEEKGALVYHVISGQYMIDHRPVRLDTYLLIYNSDAQLCEKPSGLEVLLRKMEDKNSGIWKVYAFVNNLSLPDDSKYGYCHVRANGNLGLTCVSYSIKNTCVSA